MKASADAYEIIKHFEGLRLSAYPDPASGGAPWTIGYGTTVYPDGRKVSKGDGITAEEAESYLHHDVGRVEDGVSRLVRVPLAQCQYDALVSIAYNIGLGNLAKSRLLNRVNGGRMDEAVAEFLKWNRAGGRPSNGLTIRREAEQELFVGHKPALP